MGTAHCINLNASNEIAVEAFLSGKINFHTNSRIDRKNAFKAEATNKFS